MHFITCLYGRFLVFFLYCNSTFASPLPEPSNTSDMGSQDRSSTFQIFADGTQDLAALLGLFATDSVERFCTDYGQGALCVAVSHCSVLGFLGWVRAMVKLGIGAKACEGVGFPTANLRNLLGVAVQDRLSPNELTELNYVSQVYYQESVCWKLEKKILHTKDSLAIFGLEPENLHESRQQNEYIDQDPRGSPCKRLSRMRMYEETWFPYGSPQYFLKKKLKNFEEWLMTMALNDRPFFALILQMETHIMHVARRLRPRMIVIPVFHVASSAATALTLLPFSKEWSWTRILGCVGFMSSTVFCSLMWCTVYHVEQLPASTLWNEQTTRSRYLAFFYTGPGYVVFQARGLIGTSSGHWSTVLRFMSIGFAALATISYVCQYIEIRKTSAAQSGNWLGIQAGLALLRLAVWVLGSSQFLPKFTLDHTQPLLRFRFRCFVRWRFQISIPSCRRDTTCPYIKIPTLNTTARYTEVFRPCCISEKASHSKEYPKYVVEDELVIAWAMTRSQGAMLTIPRWILDCLFLHSDREFGELFSCWIELWDTEYDDLWGNNCLARLGRTSTIMTSAISANSKKGQGHDDTLPNAEIRSQNRYHGQHATMSGALVQDDGDALRCKARKSFDEFTANEGPSTSADFTSSNMHAFGERSLESWPKEVHVRNGEEVLRHLEASTGKEAPHISGCQKQNIGMEADTCSENYSNHYQAMSEPVTPPGNTNETSVLERSSSWPISSAEFNFRANKFTIFRPFTTPPLSEPMYTTTTHSRRSYESYEWNPSCNRVPMPRDFPEDDFFQIPGVQQCFESTQFWDIDPTTFVQWLCVRLRDETPESLASMAPNIIFVGCRIFKTEGGVQLWPGYYEKHQVYPRSKYHRESYVTFLFPSSNTTPLLFACTSCNRHQEDYDTRLQFGMSHPHCGSGCNAREKVYFDTLSYVHGLLSKMIWAVEKESNGDELVAAGTCGRRRTPSSEGRRRMPVRGRPNRVGGNRMARSTYATSAASPRSEGGRATGVSIAGC